MGTRSITRIFSDKNKKYLLVSFYRQFDGFPRTAGLEIAEILKEKEVTSGIEGDHYNGIGDLAFRLITELKNKNSLSPGNLYIVEKNYDTNLVSYVYDIWPTGDKSEYFGQEIGSIGFKCWMPYSEEPLYEGSPEGFIELIKKVKLKKKFILGLKS